MYGNNKECCNKSVLQHMQRKVIPSLFNLMENCRKIEYLFVFDVGKELGELFLCSGYIIDVSNGIRSKKNKMFYW